MERLVKIIQDTIRELYSEINFLPDIELAYSFLIAIGGCSLKSLKKDFRGSVKDTRTFAGNRRQKEPIYKDRKVSDHLVNELTERALELLDYMMESAGGDMEDYFEEFNDGNLIQLSYYTFSEVMIKENEGKLSTISGLIKNVSYRSSSKKKFAYLTVADYKGIKVTVLVSSTFYNQYEEDLKNCKGKYVGVMGKIYYDNFRKSLIIKAYELDIVKGYHIPRVPITTN